MRTIDLSARLLSESVWTRVLEHAAPRQLFQSQDFFGRTARLDELRKLADYDTGSIGSSTQWSLFALSYLWKPRLVIEVGTFIGKSTVSIALGAAAAGVRSEIHTCDASNSFDLPTLGEADIVQYPATQATQMFNELAQSGRAGQCQLVHLDGRLQQADCETLASLVADDAIIALDDFEGIEKGVANMIKLRSTSAFEGHLRVYPPSPALLARFGLTDSCTMALMLPRAALRLTAQ